MPEGRFTLVKKISFPCVQCQQVVEIAPDIISRAMDRALEGKNELLVTCAEYHLNRVVIDAKSGVLLEVDKGRLPI